MLRGFRWQFAALLTAVLVFALAVATRQSNTPPPVDTTGGQATPAQATASPDGQAPAALTTEVVDGVQPAATEAAGAVMDVPDAAAALRDVAGDGVPTYREALIGQVGRLNPLFASLNPVDRDISALIFEGLTRTNAYGEPEPALAQSWVVSSDGLEFIVRLREDVLWQDGVPFSADDVMFTMALLRSPDFPGDPQLQRFWRTVETEKLGTHLVRFRLTQPLGGFLDALRIGILPVHALDGTSAAALATHPFNLTPIGTGAYQLEALRTDADRTIQVVDLRVAPVFRGRPEGERGYALERVRFRLYDSFEAASAALAAGEVDGLAARTRTERAPLVNLAYGSNVVIHTTVAPSVGMIIFNWANPDAPFFREQRVRVALQAGIDRSSIIERTLTNAAVRADSPIHPGSWAYTPNLQWQPFDPNQARALLQTAEQRLGAEATAEATAEGTAEATAEPFVAAEGSLFDFTILAPDDPALTAMAQEVAAQWSQYGLTVSVDAEPVEAYEGRLASGDFDAALVELSLGDSADPDVYAFWHEGQTPTLAPDGRNYGSMADRRISQSLERARQDVSGLNRVIYYQRFQDDFVERAVAIPMYYPLYTYAVGTSIGGVQLGFTGSPADRFRTIGTWYLIGG